MNTPMTLQKVHASVDDARRQGRPILLNGTNLEGLSLQGINLSGAWLQGALRISEYVRLTASISAWHAAHMGWALRDRLWSLVGISRRRHLRPAMVPVRAEITR